MANGPVRGKSWGGLRLPSTDWPLKCRSEHRVPFDREAGKDHLDSLRGTREAGKTHLDSLRGTREAGKDQLDSLRGTREAGKDRLRGTRRHQGGRKPGRQEERINLESLRGTREAGKNHLDSLQGTREAGKDQLDSLRGTREAPGRQERTIWIAGASGLAEWRSLPATQLALCCLPGCPNGYLEFAGLSKWLSRASRAVHMAL